jgi:transcriptional regulator with XRE-family HTH domain
MPTALHSDAAFPRELRAWRQRRGLSQLDLAIRAGTTPRHLSFLETGRSRPGEDIVLRLARALDVPLRQRNGLLRAAGLSPAFPERPLDAAAMSPVRDVIRQLMAQHEPFPAYVLDARWRLRDVNTGGRWLWSWVGPSAWEGNALLALVRAPAVWAALEDRGALLDALCEALERDVVATGDPDLAADLDALRALCAAHPAPRGAGTPGPVLCPRLRVGDQVLRTLTTICRFGNAVDVTLDELRVELIFPADPATDAVLRALGTAPVG